MLADIIQFYFYFNFQFSFYFHISSIWSLFACKSGIQIAVADAYSLTMAVSALLNIMPMHSID